MKLSGESQAVLIKYGIVAIGLYLAYTSIKTATGNVIDLVKNVDLNPFDSAGFLGLSLPPASEAQPRYAGSDNSHVALLAKIGLDIKKYHVYTPNPLEPLSPLPAGTIKVKWGVNNSKLTFYAPNLNGALLNIFTL